MISIKNTAFVLKEGIYSIIYSKICIRNPSNDRTHLDIVSQENKRNEHMSALRKLKFY